MAAESSVFHSAVLRGEAAPVELGPQSNVQDNSVVEGTPGHPARIGAHGHV
jgi:carbonic anhydrase/acetyltransferase-like protein (isoleucine patch superfamily)